MSITQDEFREALGILTASKCECVRDYLGLTVKRNIEIEKQGKQLLIDAYDEFKSSGSNRGSRLSEEQLQTLTKASNAMGFMEWKYILDEAPSV